MNSVLAFLAQRRKAVAGFFTPGVTGFAVIFASNGGNLPTEHQWLGLGVACVLTAYGVHQVSNADPSTDGPEGI